MLTIPDVSDVELAFPANPPCPKWEGVPPEFKAEGKPDARYENTDHPWCKVASKLALDLRKATEWHALPKEGVDAEKAWRALQATLASFRDRVEIKIATTAYMMSEWFDDCWFDGDTHTAIGNHDLATLFEDQEDT
jgi:hypothetical protein